LKRSHVKGARNRMPRFFKEVVSEPRRCREQTADDIGVSEV
jgi:hypothetical protein